MGPLGFLTGVILGSAAAIALVLAMVMLVFALSAGGRATLAADYGSLLAAVGLFALLAGAAGAAFAGLQRQRPWRWAAQGAMWLLVAAIALWYWPAAAP